jgi:hypothetical protein
MRVEQISVSRVKRTPDHKGGWKWNSGNAVGKREIGHVHGDRLVDIPFPKKVRDEVIAAGLAEAHHILPESGWVSIWLRSPEDLEHALSLLERSLELARAQAARREVQVVS